MKRFFMEHFTRYSDAVSARYQNIGADSLSEVRKFFDKIPNCAPSDSDFAAALKKAKARTFKDRLFNDAPMLDRDAIFRIAAELDKQVRQRFEVAADRQAAERMKSYELLDKKLERQAQFEEAKKNTAAMLAMELMGGEHE